MSDTQTANKEGLKEIISKLPFTPKLPIGRKKFFVGLLLIVVVAFSVSVGVSMLLGGINFFFSAVLGVIFSYVMATWYTKRFLDIKPNTSAKVFQLSLFVLILVLNILSYLQGVMMAELQAVADYIVIHGLESAGSAPEVSAITEMYAMPVAYVRGVIGISLLLFVLFLLFKKGKKEEVENAEDGV